MPELSLVIATRNRGQQLCRALESLKTQSLPGHLFQVIVVDNGSNDNTAELASPILSQFQSSKLLRESKPGAAAARNCGVAASDAPLILFLDDDIVADPQLLHEHLLSHKQQAGIAALGAVRFPWNGDESLLSRMLLRRPELLQSFSFVDPQNVSFLHFYTCNLSMPRAFFERNPGFDEGFAGSGFEDTELGYRFLLSGGRLVFNPRASALHDIQLSAAAFRNKQFNNGRYLGYLLHKHPQLREVFLPKSRRWRRGISSGLGRAVTPLRPLFEKPWPAFLSAVLQRMCWHHLQYEFLRGLAEAERSGHRLREPQQPTTMDEQHSSR